jgi:D-ribose pyranase
LGEGIPTFSQIEEAGQREMLLERLIIAGEMLAHPHQVFEFLQECFPWSQVETVSHNLFMDLTHHAVAIIRTGEFTPCTKIILIAEVTF